MEAATKNDSVISHPDFLGDSFHIQTQVRLVFGCGKLTSLGRLATELRGRRVLLVTDRGIVEAGHVHHAVASLEQANLEVSVFDQVCENPTTADVSACVAAAQSHGADILVGLGGGSSMDTAKGCNFILTNGGEMKDYWGIGKASKPMLPLIAIPTTAGTGSECQSFALIADEKTHQKMACGDPKAAAAIAILDPELTLSQPRRVTACTGVDALSHALESAVSLKRNRYSWLHSNEATRLILHALPAVLKDPDDLDARGKMLLGAALAGIAIENSMLGAAHAAANPLTAQFNVIHGTAVGMMLPHVMRRNATLEAVSTAYADLAKTCHLTTSEDMSKGAESLIHGVECLLKEAGIPNRLPEQGVRVENLQALASSAAQQWTGRFNPVPLGEEDFLTLYQQAM